MHAKLRDARYLAADLLGLDWSRVKEYDELSCVAHGLQQTLKTLSFIWKSGFLGWELNSIALVSLSLAKQEDRCRRQRKHAVSKFEDDWLGVVAVHEMHA